MCILAVSKRGIPQPSLNTLHTCFGNNPQGAGFMYASEGFVHIRKGFMDWADFAAAVRQEAFNASDPVVYHFRISTQAGVNPQMCHPFPVTTDLSFTRELNVDCRLGAAHNGVIPLTTDRSDRMYSDTAHYVAEFLPYLIRARRDLKSPGILNVIERTGIGKWAIMDGSGYIATVGNFIEDDDGCLYSNATYRPVKYRDIGGNKIWDNRSSLFRNWDEA